MATLSVGDPEAWLPPSKPDFIFPSEFPYEFDSAPETDSGDEEDDFFAGLTRRLTQQLSLKSQKQRVVAGSPESTLNGLGSMSVSSNGSPNGASSPTTTTTAAKTTPFGAKDNTWDLIYAAAGQVARMKISSGEAANKYNQGIPSSNQTQNQSSFYSLGLKCPQLMAQRQEQVAAPKQGQWPSVWERQQQQVKAANWQKIQPPQPQISCVKGGGVGRFETGRFVVRPPPLLPQSGWPPLQTNRPQYQQNQAVASSNSGTRAVPGFVGGGGAYGGVKRECAGTGVFLPRKYSSNPPLDSKKKPSSGCSTVLLPAKVVHALNLNFDERSSYNCHQGQPRFNASFAADYAALLARRNAVLMQQRALQRTEGGFVSHEMGLPQEWTY